MAIEEFLKEHDEYIKWIKDNKVTAEELRLSMCYMYRHFHAVRFAQQKESIMDLRRHAEKKTATYEKEQAEAKIAKIAEMKRKVEVEKKAVKDENTPIPIDASAEEAIAIRQGEQQNEK